MKKKKVVSKLILNKKTVSNFDSNNLVGVTGTVEPSLSGLVICQFGGAGCGTYGSITACDETCTQTHNNQSECKCL